MRHAWYHWTSPHKGLGSSTYQTTLTSQVPQHLQMQVASQAVCISSRWPRACLVQEPHPLQIPAHKGASKYGTPFMPKISFFCHEQLFWFTKIPKLSHFSVVSKSLKLCSAQWQPASSFPFDRASYEKVIDTKKQKDLHFSTKLNIIQHVENGEKDSSVADTFGIPQSMLSTLLHNMVDIRTTGGSAGQSWKAECHFRMLMCERIKAAPYSWFLGIRARRVPVDGPILTEKVRCSTVIFHDKNFQWWNGMVTEIQGSPQDCWKDNFRLKLSCECQGNKNGCE